MNILQKPNLLSLLLLVVILILAIGYGVATYRGKPGQRNFTPDTTYQFGYDFRNPDERFSLPTELNEISGLTAYGPNQVIAVQDEDGLLFVYDLQQQEVVQRTRFGKDRDYEGVALADSMVYVLEKDGDIHGVRLPLQPEQDARKEETEFSYRNDTEGICYDSITGQLLIVPKEQGLDPELRAENHRGVYAFDLASGKLRPDPLAVIDEVDLGQIVYGEPERYFFKPSGIAVEPGTGNLFVLASVGKILIVLNRNSEILHVELLDSKLFPQPEGITFGVNRDLLISSESKSGRSASIVRFAKQPAPINRHSEASNNE
jgi:hypothetical protein